MVLTTKDRKELLHPIVQKLTDEIIPQTDILSLLGSELLKSLEMVSNTILYGIEKLGK